jgi:hypothetical protein
VRALGSPWSHSPKEALVVMLHAGLDLSRARLDVCLLDPERVTVEVTVVHRMPMACGAWWAGWAATVGLQRPGRHVQRRVVQQRHHQAAAGAVEDPHQDREGPRDAQEVRQERLAAGQRNRELP